MKNKQFRDILKTSASVVAGNALLAFAVAAFIMPHDIIMGGITGIGIVLEKLLKFDTALIILVLNIVLLIFGAFVLGKKFFLSTVASSLLYPIFLSLIEKIPNIDKLTDNALLASLFAGTLMGISMGLLMRVGSSTGGMDVINLAFHKWFHFSLSVLVYVSDIIVLGAQAVFSTPEKILLGIVTIVLETLLLDKVMIVGKAQIQVFVISEKYEEIRRVFLDKLNQGVTMSKIETGFFGKEQKGVLCVIPQRKLYDTTEIVHQIDPDAFITITKINEVRGKGFTEERIVRNKSEI